MDLRAFPQENAQVEYHQFQQAPTVGDFTGLRDELTTIVLLNGYSIKLPSKFIPLHL